MQELIPATDIDVVGRVVRLVIKCGESPNEALQLGVVRALLTFTTAEHFIAHGDCLMAAVRCVFNLALGAESESNKRTACNALLQVGYNICGTSGRGFCRACCHKQCRQQFKRWTAGPAQQLACLTCCFATP